MAKSKPHYFFKVFFPGNSSNQLKIPPAFGEHIEVVSSSRVSLKGPSGNIWKVHLVKRESGFFFEDGWKEFVENHSLFVGDFLFFRYDGNSRFRVLVFDSTACEKKKAFLAKPSIEEEVRGVEENEEAKEGMKMGEEDEEDENKPLALFKRRVEGKLKRKKGLNDISPSKKLTNKKADLCPNSGGLIIPKQECMSDSSSSSGGGTKTQRNGKNIHIKNSATSFAVNKIIKQEYQNGQVSRLQTYSNENSVSKKTNKGMEWVKCNEVARPRGSTVRVKALTSQRRPVTEEEVERTLGRASLFKSENPFAITVMQDSYVYTSFFMCIPTWFAKEHLPRENTELTLWDPYGKPWKVTYICYARHGALSGGWGKFAYANNLEKYDVCIFELIKANNLKVHIYRVVEEIKPLLRRRDKR